MNDHRPSAYWNPYTCGVGLGVVMILSFVLAGRGIGVSGALDRAVQTVTGDLSFAGLFNEWIVVEVVGLIVGAAVSAWLAGRLRMAVDKGPRISSATRLMLAAVGGTLVGFGSRFAHGCTSGQALTGGALMSTGSWIFMIALFASAYAVAGIFRKVWR